MERGKWDLLGRRKSPDRLAHVAADLFPALRLHLQQQKPFTRQ